MKNWPRKKSEAGSEEKKNKGTGMKGQKEVGKRGIK